MQYVSLCAIIRGIALIPPLEFWSPSTENLHGTILVVSSREVKEIRRQKHWRFVSLGLAISCVF